MNLHPKSVSFDLDEHWSQVQGLLRTEFDDTAYRTWLAPLDLVGLEGDRVLLAVPTRFLRDWVAAHYADRIRADQLVPAKRTSPARGWRRALFRASFGLINLGPSPDEIRQAELEARIRGGLRVEK